MPRRVRVYVPSTRHGVLEAEVLRGMGHVVAVRYVGGPLSGVCDELDRGDLATTVEDAERILDELRHEQEERARERERERSLDELRAELEAEEARRWLTR